MRRVVVIVDGEHYPPVVRAAIDELEDAVVAAVLVGGTEKLRDDEEGYGVPLEPSVEEALARHAPDVVIDLSDEPVLGPRERFALAGRVLAAGIPYEGADFRFAPPVFAPVDVPTIAVIGTGKRVGKTAVTGHVARLLARDHRIVVVAMGRGGPPEPETVRVPPTLASLLELSRAGRHAASDHLETALVAGVATVGCRRCGGGLAGAVAVSNVADGVEVALGLEPDLLLLDGSGAALPPVDAGRRLLVVSAAQPLDVAAGYLNTYRARIADLVLVSMAEADARHAELVAALRPHLRPATTVLRGVLRPRPLEPVAGERVAYFCTAPPAQHDRLAAHLDEVHGARVTGVSGSLADRSALRSELATIDADTFLVELKAAAVDVVVEEATRRGVRVVVAANDVETLPGEPPFEDAVASLASEAVARVPVRRPSSATANAGAFRGLPEPEARDRVAGFGFCRILPGEREMV